MKAISPSGSPYIVGRFVDFFFVGGVSLVVFLGARLWPGVGLESASSFAALLMWIINWPHFAATSFRLYSARANRAQYPTTAYFVPVMVGVAAVGALAFPTVIAPFFIKLILIWSPYHFSGQTVGVSLLYSRRSSFPIDPTSRWALAAFVFGTFVFTSLQGQESTALTPYFGVNFPGLGTPPWLTKVAYWGTHVAGVLLVVSMLRQGRRIGVQVPFLFWIPAVTQYTWFVLGPSAPVFYAFVPLFHSLQYLFIAWILQLRERLSATRRSPSWRFVASESFRWSAFNFVGGVALFYLLPRLGSLLGVPLGLSEAVLVAAVQLHHFIVDGVIWKLRSPEVVSPLMASLGDIAHGPKTEGPPTRKLRLVA